MIQKKDDQWVQDIWKKIDCKMLSVVIRSKDKIPYTTHNGIHDDCSQSRCAWWTNGFWPGLLWLLYLDTKNEIYKTTAVHAEDSLSKALELYDELHHDVGFMWHISSGVDYRTTGDPRSRLRVLYAANLLAGRYNLKGEYIRAWNDGIEGDNNKGWTIIDCMMNIPLLYWISEECKDPRYAYIARAHANKAMRYHIREDGSVRHIVEYDLETGEFIREIGGQGYGENSSWSRGQAWGLYGFILSYLYTKDENYLSASKKIAHYFISCICDDWLPRCDFRSPAEPVIYDSTAGAIAACGLLELAENTDELEGHTYYVAAMRLLRAMEESFCDWSADTDSILGMGTERYHSESGRHIPIIYGDYFFIEAIYKLRGNVFRSW